MVSNKNRLKKNFIISIKYKIFCFSYTFVSKGIDSKEEIYGISLFFLKIKISFAKKIS